MKLKLRVDLGEGPFEVATSLATIVAWERRFKRKASELASGVGIEDLAFMAHEACKNAQITVPLALDDFIKKLEEIDVITEETANPTDRPPTADA